MTQVTLIVSPVQIALATNANMYTAAKDNVRKKVPIVNEYIEREVAIAKVVPDIYYHSNEVKNMLRYIPAANVVEVVRCRNCKYGRKSKDALELDGETPLCECSYMYLPHRWGEYCSWGERKEGAE